VLRFFFESTRKKKKKKFSRSCFCLSQTVPFDHWRVLKGDRVEVISGKNKGLRGEVKQVIRARNQVVIEGVNLVKKHQAGSGEIKGGVFTREAPVSGSRFLLFFSVFSYRPVPTVSAVSLIDPGDNKPCKTRWVYLEGGEKERQSKRSNLVIPKNDLVLKTR